MSNATINDLTASTAVTDGSKIPIADSGSDTLKRATASQLLDYIKTQTGPQNQSLINLLLMGL